MKKLILLLPFLILLWYVKPINFIIQNYQTQIAYAVTDTLYPVFEGSLGNSNANRTTARNTTTASTLDSTSVFNIGTYINTSYFYLRGFFGFVLPDASQFNSIIFELDGSTDRTTTDSLWNIFSASQVNADGLTTADFDQFDGWQASGAYNGNKLITDWNTTSYSTNWNSFTFNAAGLDTALVYKNSIFWFVVTDLRDYYATWATDDSCYATFTGGLTGATAPRLRIDYDLPVVSTTDKANVPINNGQPMRPIINGRATEYDFR